MGDISFHLNSLLKMKQSRRTQCMYEICIFIVIPVRWREITFKMEENSAFF